MDRWNSVPEMLQSVRLSVLKVALVLCGLALLGKDLGSLLGLAVGALLALWQFGSLSASMQKAVQMGKLQAEAYSAIRYMMRYFVIALAVTAAYFTKELNFAAVIVGLFLVKIVIIGYAVREAIREGGAAYLRQLALKRVRKEG